ncbi:melanopsin-A-like [Amphiura filiformis]|uniref:melanopsin-A-like n=1 Tax=Amphiura filiformis TaxID=82378 RepID=UPI003B225A13
MELIKNTVEINISTGLPYVDDTFISKEQQALNVINGVIGSLGIVGNGLVLVVIFNNWKSFQSLTHLLILHQSIIDFTSSLVFTLLRMDRWQPLLAKQGTVGEIFCRLWHSEYPLWALFMTSTLNLVLLSTERYLAVVHPVRHLNKLSRGKIKLSMAAVWFIGFGYQSYLAATNTSINGECVWGWKAGTEELQRFVGILTFFLEYFCPLCVISVEYIFIALKLRNLDKSRSNRRQTIGLEDGASRATSMTAASTCGTGSVELDQRGTGSTRRNKLHQTLKSNKTVPFSNGLDKSNE